MDAEEATPVLQPQASAPPQAELDAAAAAPPVVAALADVGPQTVRVQVPPEGAPHEAVPSAPPARQVALAAAQGRAQLEAERARLPERRRYRAIVGRVPITSASVLGSRIVG